MIPFNITSSHNQEPYTLLVSFCKRIINKTGFNDYEEITLYQSNKNNSYVFHALKKTGKMLDESDVAYASNEDEYKVIINKIKELKLVEYKDQAGDGQSEIKYSCKFKTENGYIRITDDNLTKDKINILNEVGNLMYSLTM